MTPPGASPIARRVTTLLVLTALMLFQLLSRADLALADLAQQHGPGILCANASGSPGDGPQNGHRACAVACAMLCHAEILPGSPAVAIPRLSQVLAHHATLRDAGRGRPSIRSLRIRGPPETGLV